MEKALCALWFRTSPLLQIDKSRNKDISFNSQSPRIISQLKSNSHILKEERSETDVPLLVSCSSVGSYLPFKSYPEVKSCLLDLNSTQNREAEPSSKERKEGGSSLPLAKLLVNASGFLACLGL